MGILTEPRTESNKFVKFLIKWEKVLCYLLYFGGLVWLMALALPTVNDYTYFSENALLPGLVRRESNLKLASEKYYRELSNERERYPDTMPYAWLLATFHTLHLDVYTHNFTLNYPFREQKFFGQNVYGIVRAPRSASMEAIVVSAPYRPISSIHPDTSPSVALLLAFAEFCHKQKYWAKDIIFLVTEHEQLGMQAWLDAYHGVTSGLDGILKAGDLSGRAGSIQAAINLELHAMQVTSIDVKVEGLNGQLPNLDLFNLAQNMIIKEEVYRSFQGRFDTIERDKYKKWWYQFNTMMSMIFTQATGVPTGNHGLFHRFGIEAVTLEGFEKSRPGSAANFYKVGRIVESIVRSLNNLLERFHQSFFFYLLPSTDRYISIGLYMPSLVLITAGLFIKAFCSWLRMHDAYLKSNNEAAKEKNSKVSSKNEKEERDSFITQSIDFDVGSIASEILWAHIMGIMLMSSFKIMVSSAVTFFDFKTEDTIYYGFAMITLFTLLLPLLTKKWAVKYNNVALVCVVTSVEFATVLLCVSMHNFSLALLTAMVYVPLTLTIAPKQKTSIRFRKLLYVVWPLLHPFIVIILVIIGYTFINYAGEPLLPLLIRALRATKQAFVLSVIDSMIYGNWLYNVAVAVMLPIWFLYWNVFNATILTES